MGWYSEDESVPDPSSCDESEPPIDEDCTPSDPESPVSVIGELIAKAPTILGDFSFGGHASTLPAIPGLVSMVLGSKIYFENPAWGKGLDALKVQLAARLGLEDMPLELHLYKMLIYEKGGHFVRHCDTEKDDRMFAILVVQLPSLHQGGHLVVYHNGPQGEEETIHDFGGAAAPFEPHYAVHPSQFLKQYPTSVLGIRWRASDARSCFEHGLHLTHVAHQNQVAPEVSAKFLPVALSALPPTIAEQQQLQITQLLGAPLWEHARGPLLDALAADKNKFAVRLQVFSMAVNAQVTTDAAMSILPLVLQAIPNDLSSQKISNMALLMSVPYWQHAQGPLLAALSTTPARFKVGPGLIQNARNRKIPDGTWQPLLPIAMSGFPTVFNAGHTSSILVLMQPLFWPSARDHVLQGCKSLPLEPQPKHRYPSSTAPMNVGRLQYHLPQLVSLMDPKLWPSSSKHVINALSKLPVRTSSHSATNPRFEIGLDLVDKARGAAIPVEVWQQFLSTVISGIDTSNLDNVASSEYQTRLWRTTFATSDESIIDLAINTYHSLATPVQLKPVVNCILSLSENCTPGRNSYPFSRSA
ncbi:hypothetical protein HK102_010415 [Quaeritorhiza haematococci]|nr:hypothetical protein HK102_010415 [Quaeritorhiza haematococci]